ncbi:MAG TPA: hypothetical protein EYP30_06335, partial [Archaeoglobaceae archaeon]|nr:hypothetical protein [Archaeoglobaceae archaeon]
MRHQQSKKSWEKLSKLTKKQEKTIKQALKAYGSLNFIENYSLLVNENREVFALSKKLADFILE